jgi:hypothetical protein
MTPPVLQPAVWPSAEVVHSSVNQAAANDRHGRRDAGKLGVTEKAACHPLRRCTRELGAGIEQVAVNGLKQTLLQRKATT